MTNFTIDEVKAVEKSTTLESAKDYMISIINKAHPNVSEKPMNPRKIAFLIEQVNSRKTIDQIAAIGYNMILVGEGLGSATSSYQTLFKGKR
jgi:hypothetical protein